MAKAKLKSRAKVHYRGPYQKHLAACGMEIPTYACPGVAGRLSPEAVTCGKCKNTIDWAEQMARQKGGRQIDPAGTGHDDGVPGVKCQPGEPAQPPDKGAQQEQPTEAGSAAQPGEQGTLGPEFDRDEAADTKTILEAMDRMAEIDNAKAGLNADKRVIRDTCCESLNLDKRAFDVAYARRRLSAQDPDRGTFFDGSLKRTLGAIDHQLDLFPEAEEAAG